MAKRKSEKIGEVKLHNGKVTAELYRDTDPNGRIVLRCLNKYQTPLDKYYAKGQITPEMFSAGNKLRRDFFLAGRTPNLTMDLMREGRSASVDYASDIQVQAELDYKVALKNVGSLLAEVLFDVCCLDKTARTWQKAMQSMGFSRDDGMAVLRAALLVLYRHYSSYIKA